MNTRRAFLSWLGLAPVAAVVPLAAIAHKQQAEPFSPVTVMDLKTSRDDDDIRRMIDREVKSALRQYDEHLDRTLPRKLMVSQNRFG